MARLALFIALSTLPACTGELTALAALVFGVSFGAWIFGRDRQRRALVAAESLRYAIASGDHRRIEADLRRELALAAAGETISPERRWLARAQLGALLVAEWRLDEAAALYTADDAGLSPHLQALSAFGRHELAVVAELADKARLAEIRADRDRCLGFVPEPYKATVARAWGALEGLCLARMGWAREAIPLLEAGLDAIELNPARILYLFHLAQACELVSDHERADMYYGDAALAFPGTRLASEARSRLNSLGNDEHAFRGMLPEAPAASRIS